MMMASSKVVVMARGRLRIYLGVAPGAGSTHAALDEVGRRIARGQRVLGAALDADAEASAALAPLPRLDVTLGDQAAVQQATPTAVLIDDLAAPLPHDPTHQRWELVDGILAVGVDVIASTDVTAVASLADEIERFTGRRAPTVPDSLLKRGQLELVDLTPEALRRRLAHGSLLRPEQMDADSARQFSLATLRGLRELAYGYVLGALRAQHPDASPIIVAVSGGRNSGAVLRRGVRAATNEPGASVLAVEVVGASDAAASASEELRALAESFGVEYRQVIGTDVARALVDVAETLNARRLVVGAGSGALGADVAAELLRLGSDLEIDVVPGGAPTAPRTALASRFAVTRGRTVAGGVLSLALPGAMTGLSLAAGSWLGLPAITMLHLVAVVVVSLVGGLVPAVVAALVASTLLNYWFIPPLHSLLIGDPHNVLAVALFLLVAVLVSWVVGRAARESARAARSAAESQALLGLADARLRGPVGLSAIVDQARETFAMESASLLSRRPDEGWDVLEASGPGAPASPSDADASVPAGSGHVLALRGRPLSASDQVVLHGYAAHAASIIERDQLASAAAEAERLKATESLRDALLAAVGHDLRRPLASARAAIEGLRSSGDLLSDAQRDALLEAGSVSLRRLTRIVDDLLDLSRLQTGALQPAREEVWLDDVVPPALDDLGDEASGVRLRLPADLPAAVADAALVRRIVANLVGNALAHGSSDEPPVVSASALDGRLELRVTDRGPGLTAGERTRAFLPFQRVGDGEPRSGLGLGLALARGLAEAMGGTLEPEDTPGGGLTVVLALPAAPTAPDAS